MTASVWPQGVCGLGGSWERAKKSHVVAALLGGEEGVDDPFSDGPEPSPFEVLEQTPLPGLLGDRA